MTVDHDKRPRRNFNMLTPGAQAYICQEQHGSGTQLAARRIIKETRFQKPSSEGSPLSHIIKISFFAQKRPAENSKSQKERERTLTSPCDTTSSLHTLVINVSFFGKRGWDFQLFDIPWPASNKSLRNFLAPRMDCIVQHVEQRRALANQKASCICDIVPVWSTHAVP